MIGLIDYIQNNGTVVEYKPDALSLDFLTINSGYNEYEFLMGHKASKTMSREMSRWRRYETGHETGLDRFIERYNLKERKRRTPLKVHPYAYKKKR